MTVDSVRPVLPSQSPVEGAGGHNWARWSGGKEFHSWLRHLAEGTGSTGDVWFVVHDLSNYSCSQLVAVMSEARPASSPEPQFDVATEVNEIRTTFGLTVTDLSSVLGVERPTVYSWLKGASSPHEANVNRIEAIGRLAKRWKRLAPDGVRPNLKRLTGLGVTLLDALRAENLANYRLGLHIETEAKAIDASRPETARELARRAGVREVSEAEFDRATGRPISPEA